MLNILSPDYRRNPYANFMYLRAHEPVCKTTPHGFWAISRHADVKAVLENSETFSSTAKDEQQASRDAKDVLRSRGLVAMDGERHRWLRKLVSRAMPLSKIDILRCEISKAANEVVDGVLVGKTFDFVSEFASLLPIYVMAQLLGIERARCPDFRRWVNTLLTWRHIERIKDDDERARRYEEVDQELESMRWYLGDLVDRRKREPNTDVVSTLAGAINEKMTMADVIMLIRFLMVAGTDTTTHLLGNVMVALLEHPNLFVRMHDKPCDIAKLVNECSRHFSPVLGVMRRATKDVIIADVNISKDENVFALIASANRDEAVFHQPDVFNIDRDFANVLTFGAGPHLCIGAQLAKLQTRIGIEVVTKRLGHLALANNEPIEWIDSLFFRGPRALNVNAASGSRGQWK